MAAFRRGYVHVYTGDGKGKTTAALGLALRASGGGLKVYIQQFAKKGECSEVKALRRLKNIKVSQCGNGPFVIGAPTMRDIECARRGFEAAKRNMLSEKYDVVILDEINIAAKLGLLNTQDIAGLIKSKPPAVELVLTGRSCSKAMIRRADIVTEMREVRHPYRRGVQARRGIDF